MTHDIIEQAQELWSTGREDEAILILTPLAESDDTIAKANLGLMLCHYFRDDKFPKFDEGAKMLLEACEAGEPSACHNLGTLWLGNIPSIGNDTRKAAGFYLKARELGGPVAPEEFYNHWEDVLRG